MHAHAVDAPARRPWTPDPERQRLANHTIEDVQNPVHVYAYELGANGVYRLVADCATELVLEKPFEIRLPISEITP